MKRESKLDAWAKAGVARERSRPRWQKLPGNFGFGFIFLGFLANLALFFPIAVFEFGSSYLYNPWWLNYLLVSSLTGWSWRHHGRHGAEPGPCPVEP